MKGSINERSNSLISQQQHKWMGGGSAKGGEQKYAKEEGGET